MIQFAAVLVALAATTSTADVTVVSYNQYWWHVKLYNQWGQLYSRVSGTKPADLLGFQECEDVAQVVGGAGLSGYSYYEGPNKPDGNPAPLVWSDSRFQKIGGPQSIWVAYDQYKNRYMNWVRLLDRSSGATIFFANTHGPLGNCDATLGNNWLNGIKANMQAGDHIIFTGDFNCGSGSAAVNVVKSYLHGGVESGIDHILTNLPTVSGGAQNGAPSDHPLLRGTFQLGGTPSPAPSPTPSSSASCSAPENPDCNNLSGYCCPASDGTMLSCCGSSTPTPAPPPSRSASCTAPENPGCNNLIGDCCPASDGTMLSCCDSSTRVVLKMTMPMTSRESNMTVMV